MKGRLCFTEKGNREKSETFSRTKKKTRIFERRRRKPRSGEGKRENPFPVNRSSKFR